jgi:3-deoxy-D-manno-octulosonic-acid transferase
MLIYRIFSVLLYPVIEIYLFWRVYKKKEDKRRLKERFGISSIKRPEGGLIWIHAVSVGESNSAFILVEELIKKFSQANILFTTTTLTSAAIVEKKIPQFNGRVIHQFLPVDSYFCVKSFFDFWQPDLAVFVESEIWPNLLDQCVERQIPKFLINARLSEDSLKKWSWAKFFGVKIFDNFEIIFAQSLEDQRRLQKLSKNKVEYFGNLKSQARDLEVNNIELEKLKSQIKARKLFIAASTHKGEEEIIIKTHKDLKKEFPDLLTIIVPRHPNRSSEIASLLSDVKFSVRSKNEEIFGDSEVYLADTLGELGIFYSLADFAFIGGSLANVGGHNPFEAIKLNCAVISGNMISNFKEIYRDLEQNNSCVIVDSKEQLCDKVRNFLQNDKLPQELLKKANEAILNSQNISERIVENIFENLS